MTPVAVPTSRPKLSHDDARKRLAALGVDTSRPALLGVRGYYRDTMGIPLVNDTGVYDDAIFLVSPTAFSSYNANTDPSRDHPQVATLKTGVWIYRVGIHGLSRAKDKQYRALVQGAPVTVNRAATNPGGLRKDDTGWFGINIHRGSINSTSSEGCQTIYPLQWEAFIAAVADAMERAQTSTIPYVLVEGA